MAITTYLNPHEMDQYSHVSDEPLDKLYQDVRKLSNGRMLIQERNIEIKRLFRKPIKKTLYTLYHYHGSAEVQIINFHQDHDWSINTDVTASYIYAYFYGYFNGHHHGQVHHLSNTNVKSQ
jgi:hypothetical protein